MSGRAIVLVASIGLLAASVASQFSPSSSAAEPVAGQSEAAPATQTGAPRRRTMPAEPRRCWPSFAPPSLIASGIRRAQRPSLLAAKLMSERT